MLKLKQAIVKTSPSLAAGCRLLTLSELDIRHAELMTAMDRGIKCGILDYLLYAGPMLFHRVQRPRIPRLVSP